MARCPFATWRGSPNVGGTPVRPARGLVVHVEVGTEAGTISCFENPSFKASAHFGCDTDGSLDQFVDTDAEAWAEVAGNPGWISVETAGYPTDPLTPAQVEAVGTLFAWLRGLYGFPAQTCDHDGTGLTTHAHYPSGQPDPSWGGHPCPGAARTAQLPDILTAAGGSTTPGEAMGKFNLIAVDLVPGSVGDYAGRLPFYGTDHVGAVFAFNGALPIRGLNQRPELGHARTDVVGIRAIRNGQIVLFCDDGHPDPKDTDAWAASTYELS